MFNFIPSLTPNDHANYIYIALGYVAHNSSFYASLHAQQAPQQENLHHSEPTFSSTLNINNETSDTSDIEWKEPNENREDIDILLFVAFLEEVKLDYQNAGKPLRAALDKFKERYNVTKSKSISRLSFYLYNLNHNMDLMARVKSDTQIRVQVESVKRRKVENGRRKRRFPASANKEKENTDPQTIPARKKKKI
ncbi:11687_t:CDS:1, partial [Racocetra persica]